MNLANSTTLGANFFLLFGLGQFLIWLGFVIYVIVAKKKDPVRLVFGSAVVVLVLLLVTVIGCLTYF